MAITELKEWFQGIGTPVVGERLVGKSRRALSLEICNQFFSSKTGTNMMMNGLPRIGKTSVLREARRLYEGIVQDSEKKVVCFIDMTKYQSCSPQELYFAIISSVYDAIPQGKKGLFEYYINWFSERLEQAQPLVRITRQVLAFFKDCKDAKLSIRIVFDEFDSILSVFRVNDLHIDERGLISFQGLIRELISEDAYDIKAFFISRNQLEEIEPENSASPLSNVCGVSITLSLFGQDEIEDYWATLSRYDTKGAIDDTFKSCVMQYAGGYPYLMNLIASILESSQTHMLIDSIVQQYNSIVKMLDVKINLKEFDNVSLKDTLLQLMIGPQHNISLFQVKRLARYDIIRQKEDMSYETFCPFFLEYLEHLAMHVSIWDVIGTFERKMRIIIANYLESIGDSEFLIQSDIISNNYRKTLLGRRDKDRRWGLVSNDSLLDYLYTSEYIQFVEKGWKNWFERVFSNYSLDQCKIVFSFIANTRNDNQHYRPISSEDKVMIVRYVNTIVNHIDIFLRNKE